MRGVTQDPVPALRSHFLLFNVGVKRRQRTSGLTHHRETPALCVAANPPRPPSPPAQLRVWGDPFPAALHVLTGHPYNIFGEITAFFFLM